MNQLRISFKCIVVLDNSYVSAFPVVKQFIPHTHFPTNDVKRI